MSKTRLTFRITKSKVFVNVVMSCKATKTKCSRTLRLIIRQLKRSNSNWSHKFKKMSNLTNASLT